MVTSGAESPEPWPLEFAIDLACIESNLGLIRQLAGPSTQVIAALKANAYGHGAVPVARHLESLGVHSLATGSAVEARAVRAAGVELPILLFAAARPGDLAALCAEGFVPSITSLAAARRLSSDLSGPAPVYLKVDVGLGRLGIPLADALETITTVCGLPGLRVEGLYTHAPFSTASGREWARARLASFDRLVESLAVRGLRFPITQARASGCLLAGLQDRCNAVCVGHALYGLRPFAPELAPESVLRSALRPALRRLATRIIQIVEHGQGADIAIAGELSIERTRTIAVLPVGLSNGVGRPRRGQQAAVLVQGRPARVLAVSLEHTTIELPAGTSALVGDEAVLIGTQGDGQISLEQFAAWREVSPLESLMHLSTRLD